MASATVAAVAIARGLTLVTDNVKDYTMTDLETILEVQLQSELDDPHWGAQALNLAHTRRVGDDGVGGQRARISLGREETQ